MFAGLQLSEVSTPQAKLETTDYNEFNLQGGGDEANPFLPFVQGMMQSLLSSEVLLPSLTELLEKYPTWLAENADKIDPPGTVHETTRSIQSDMCGSAYRET